MINLRRATLLTFCQNNESMKPLVAILSSVLVASCASVRVPERYAQEQAHYVRGAEEAKRHHRDGVRRIAAIECYEEEDWRTLWVMKRLLKQRYNIDYKVIAPSPIPAYVAYVEGYNSIALAPLEQILGDDWYRRLWSDAETYKKANWEDLKDSYESDRQFQS